MSAHGLRLAPQGQSALTAQQQAATAGRNRLPVAKCDNDVGFYFNHHHRRAQSPAPVRARAGGARRCDAAAPAAYAGAPPRPRRLPRRRSLSRALSTPTREA